MVVAQNPALQQFICGNGEIIRLKLPQNSANEMDDVVSDQDNPCTKY